MLFKCMFSGSGGQGSALMAKIVCKCAMKESLNVVMTQTYGIEQRGGDSTAFVIISDEPIGSPIVEKDANVAVGLSQTTYQSCFEGTAPGGILFCNTSLVEYPGREDGFTQVRLPVSDIAVEVGSVKSANIVMLGAVIEKTGMLRKETVEDVITDLMKAKKPALVDLNIRAFRAGYAAAQKG